MLMNKFMNKLKGRYVKIIKNKINERSGYWSPRIYKFLNKKLKVVDVFSEIDKDAVVHYGICVCLPNNYKHNMMTINLPYEWITPFDFDFGAEINRTLLIKYKRKNIQKSKSGITDENINIDPVIRQFT